MQALSTLRGWHIQQLEHAIPIYTHVLGAISPTTASTVRDGGDGWTILQIMGHLRDFERIFIERAMLTLNADNPPLPFPDPDQMAASKNDNATTLQDVLGAWSAARLTLIDFYKAIDDEATWERPAAHPTRGAFTLHDQLFLTVWHDSNHLKQIANMLK